MTAFTLRLLLVLRLLCFMALVYLALHVLVARLIANPHSKVLWFFSVLTAPLLWPLRAWRAPDVPTVRLLPVALGVYGVLWVLVVIVTQLVANGPH